MVWRFGICLVLFFLASPGIAQPVLNGGFDSGLEGWLCSFNCAWSAEDQEGNVNSGSAEVELANESPFGGTPGGFVQQCFQLLDPGAHRFVAWFRDPQPTSHTLKAGLFLEGFDNSTCGGPANEVLWTAASVDELWTRVELTGSISSSFVSLYAIASGGEDRGTLLVDRVEAVSVASVPSLHPIGLAFLGAMMVILALRRMSFRKTEPPND